MYINTYIYIYIYIYIYMYTHIYNKQLDHSNNVIKTKTSTLHITISSSSLLLTTVSVLYYSLLCQFFITHYYVSSLLLTTISVLYYSLLCQFFITHYYVSSKSLCCTKLSVFRYRKHKMIMSSLKTSSISILCSIKHIGYNQKEFSINQCD